MVLKPLRRLSLLSLAVLVALVPAPARAQARDFDISQNRTHVGTATFRFTATPGGFDSTSVVRISMQGLNYALSKTEQLDHDRHLVHIILSGIVNGSAVNIIGTPDSGKDLLIISANGRSSTSRLDAHPVEVVIPDFDPGALDTLLALAATQNNRDLWAILPKGAGSVAQVRLATYADQDGTLDGKPVTVHHLVATIGGDTIDLFSGPTNHLLQAELTSQGFAIVRKGFVLTPPAKPIVPAQ
jgi:hypothetical protein